MLKIGRVEPKTVKICLMLRLRCNIKRKKRKK